MAGDRAARARTGSRGPPRGPGRCTRSGKPATPRCTAARRSTCRRCPRRTRRARSGRRPGAALIGLGAFFVGNAGTYYAALQYISASLASLIVYIYPALVAVLSIRFGHGLHGRRPWAALGIVTFGVALTLGGIQTHADPVGLALIVASPCIYAVYIILAARLAGERRGETANDRTGGDGAETRPAVVAAVMLSATFAVVALMAVAAGEPTVPWLVPGDAWFGLAGIAIFSTAVAISAFYAGTAVEK